MHPKRRALLYKSYAGSTPSEHPDCVYYANSSQKFHFAEAPIFSQAETFIYCTVTNTHFPPHPQTLNRVGEDMHVFYVEGTM